MEGRGLRSATVSRSVASAVPRGSLGNLTRPNLQVNEPKALELKLNHWPSVFASAFRVLRKHPLQRFFERPKNPDSRFTASFALHRKHTP